MHERANIMGDLRDDLARSGAYPLPAPARIDVLETHVSLVLRTEGDVYKLKKPVALGFVDLTSVDARQRACEEEVSRGGRLAAGVYLGVVPVRLGDDGRACFHGEGEVVDWAVHMLRLPDRARADVRLANDRLGVRQIDRLADHIAAFHSRASTSEAISAHGSVAAIASLVRESFDHAHHAAARLLPVEHAVEIVRGQVAFLERNRSLLESRRRRGFVRDGHGDLRLAHIYFSESPEDAITILEGAALAARYRCADVACDIAFLSMDLRAAGRIDLAERLLVTYARATGDRDLFDVIDFYESHRAYARANVATIRAAGAHDRSLRQDADADARRYFLLALACERRAARSRRQHATRARDLVA